MGSKQSKSSSNDDVKNVNNKSVNMAFNKDYIEECHYSHINGSNVLFTGQTKHIYQYIERKVTLLNGHIRLSNGLIIKGDFSKERVYYHDLTYEYKTTDGIYVQYQSGLCDDISIWNGAAFIYVTKNGYVYKCKKVINSRPIGGYTMFDRDGGVFKNDIYFMDSEDKKYGSEYKKTNGDIYKGQFNNEYKLHGKGEVVHVDGNVYSGEFFNGKFKNGIHTDNNGIKYEGKFCSSDYGVHLLYGKITKLNGEIIIGEFNKMGRPHGRCVVKYNNRLMEDGEYINGEMVSGFKYKYAIDGTVYVCNEKGETLNIYKGESSNNKCVDGDGEDEEKSTTSIIPNAPEGIEGIECIDKKNSSGGGNSNEENINIPPGGVPVEC